MWCGNRLMHLKLLLLVRLHSSSRPRAGRSQMFCRQWLMTGRVYNLNSTKSSRSSVLRPADTAVGWIWINSCPLVSESAQELSETSVHVLGWVAANVVPDLKAAPPAGE